MIAIFQTTFSNEFSWVKMLRFQLKFVPYGPVNKSSLILIQIMGWCQTGDKPLTEPMMALFTDAHMCNSGLSLNELKCISKCCCGVYQKIYTSRPHWPARSTWRPSMTSPVAVPRDRWWDSCCENVASSRCCDVGYWRQTKLPWIWKHHGQDRPTTHRNRG